MDQQQPREENEDVITLWENLSSTVRGTAVAGIVTYLFTLAIALGLGEYIPWLATVILIVWPLVVIAWVVVIWVAFAAFSVARVLVGGDSAIKNKDPKKLLLKTVIFIPTVIGTALTVVNVFASDIFSSEETSE